MLTMNKIFALLLLFQVKHYIADYPLQLCNRYMLGKFKEGWDFVQPLAAHCLVHAFMSFFIVAILTNDSILAIKLGLFDFTVHFIMDRIKAGPKYLGKYKAINEFEWKSYRNEIESGHNEFEAILERRFKESNASYNALGIDQMVHHITHYVIIYFILTK